MLAVIGDPVIQATAMAAFHPFGKGGWVRPWETPGHLDGWGIVKYSPTGPVCVAHSGGDVDAEGVAYATASAQAAELFGRLAMVHFRKATRGSICAANSQPFTEGRWAFCHNGTVTELEKLGPCAPVTDESDSKEFFRRWCLQGQDIARYRDWIDCVAAACANTSLTSLLTNGEQLIACRQSSGTLCDPAPANFDPACLQHSYTLHHWTKDGAHVICSEVLSVFAGEWHNFANGELMMITV